MGLTSEATDGPLYCVWAHPTGQRVRRTERGPLQKGKGSALPPAARRCGTRFFLPQHSRRDIGFSWVSSSRCASVRPRVTWAILHTNSLYSTVHCVGVQSRGCCDTGPQPGWFKRTQMYLLTVQEARRLGSRYWQHPVPLSVTPSWLLAAVTILVTPWLVFT